MKFNGRCLKQDKITYTHGKTVSIYICIYIYIACEINKFNISSYPTLEKYLFGAVSLAKNNDIDEYKIPGYGIGFDRKGELSFGNEFVRN